MMTRTEKGPKTLMAMGRKQRLADGRSAGVAVGSKMRIKAIMCEDQKLDGQL
jgi:hypothetical protein